MRSSYDKKYIDHLIHDLYFSGEEVKRWITSLLKVKVREDLTEKEILFLEEYNNEK